ncbi:MAG: IPT/TIG domain-containing protein [Candidatus Symbiothrix sp.]|jgi:hypothetical protein|nr:IPT/TIG domain-containing protein [Candidatus Symbiothrix sp.]
MKYNKIFKSMVWVMLAVFTVCFTACSDDDGSGSGDLAVLEAFGPSPALRGGKLTFIGKNLDKVIKVVIPDNIEITDITVVNSGEISVIIPQNAVVGHVKLITPRGELVSKSLLTYTEPIELSSMAPNPVKPGTTLTIEGDYLNLIQQVIFADDVAVKCEQFTTWNRGKIELTVPFEAQTGKIILADTAAIRLELESEYELQVVLPSVDSPADLTGKKPGEAIVIPGHDLDLVVAVEMPNGNSVDFTVDNDVLKFTLPGDISDGAIVMIPASGVHVAAANIGVAVPSDLTAVPNENIRAEDEIKITGVNMDLVTTVTFPGVSIPVTPTSQNATEIRVLMPETATSGDLVLNTASGNTASVAISTLKPRILDYNPSSVPAGSVVTITGTNLDLAETVTFSGGKVGTIVSQSTTELKVTVPVDAETGAVTLKMTNGETVDGASLTVTKPVFAYIPELPGPEVEIKAGTILQVAIENGDKLTGVQVNGIAVQYILSGSTLNVLIPENAGGNTSLRLISSNGEVTYVIQVIGNSTIETVVWTGPVDLTWSAGGRVYVPYSAFEGVAAGSILKIYFVQHPGWGQCQINDGSWGGITFAELGGATLNTDNCGGSSATSIELALTPAILDQIATNKGEDGANNPGIINGIIMQGGDWTVAKVSIITKGGGGGPDPVQDPAYVYFDFNDGTKNSWWGQVNVNTPVGDLWEGVENDPNYSVDGTPYAKVNNGSGMFFRNGANNMKLDGVTLIGWVVKFDVRVLSGSGAIRLELQSGGTQYMAVVDLTDTGGWYTQTVQFSDFKDNWGSGTNSLPDLNIDEFGATDGGGGNTMELLIDNVRFEHN